MKGRRVLAFVVASWLGLLSFPGTAAACSPPFNPTIRELGPEQLVVVGTVGERVPGGRLFHVDRWFNGGEPGTPIVIAFKEGEPIGDCSYPVATGERKIIAPVREPDGRLSADLGTLQADPASADGRRYLGEAIDLFGEGVIMEVVTRPGARVAAWAMVAAVVLVVATVLIGVVFRR